MDDGRTWEERGEAIGLGRCGEFDSFGVFTPNILARDGEFWLYYTAVKPTPDKGGLFENNATNDPTAIAVAVADSPDGPFARVGSNPVLTVGDEREAFDSYRVDDAGLVIGEGKVWLYYKGRSAAHGPGGPGRTRMGVAVADHPAGPFVKQNGGRPVQDSGHEVQVFAHKGAVMSLVSATGPNGRTLQCAQDGLKFRVLLRGLANLPKAPGLHRPELTDAAADQALPTWGIAMGTYDGHPYLLRYECVWDKP
jgi:beta-xylosidase